MIPAQDRYHGVAPALFPLVPVLPLVLLSNGAERGFEIPAAEEAVAVPAPARGEAVRKSVSKVPGGCARSATSQRGYGRWNVVCFALRVARGPGETMKRRERRQEERTTVFVPLAAKGSMMSLSRCAMATSGVMKD